MGVLQVYVVVKYNYSMGNINSIIFFLVYPPKAENFFGLK